MEFSWGNEKSFSPRTQSAVEWGEGVSLKRAGEGKLGGRETPALRYMHFQENHGKTKQCNQHSPPPARLFPYFYLKTDLFPRPLYSVKH